ncbi:piggyBac transposable element-derived protein 2-like [Schistocerca nitens]|uniref:piggyBac transposable element-derived protein 2-like n=1 Tax=Schistocerca nitens TaxID=7011 RepID=UPI002117AC68|nr:piggyBac transposable element-derived protein 2-like [Schistocerca nitens]
MLRLAQTLPQESFIYFTSLPLLEKLTEMKLYGSGTIMANRLKGLPLSDASKMVHGQSIEHVAVNCDLVVVEWKDSNKVIMASNCCGTTPTEPVQRWSKIDNKHIEVDCPSVVCKYNQNMDGVDVCDQQMECYRAWFRSMKWTWKVILHFVDLAVVNAWNQYMRSIKRNNIPRKEQKDLLHFKLEVAEGLLAVPPEDRRVLSETEQEGDILPVAKRCKFFNQTAKLPCSDKRYNGYEHFPISDDIPAPHTCRYEPCKSRSKMWCEKCNVYLCLSKDKTCFKEFHVPPKQKQRRQTFI